MHQIFILLLIILHNQALCLLRLNAIEIIWDNSLLIAYKNTSPINGLIYFDINFFFIKNHEMHLIELVIHL